MSLRKGTARVIALGLLAVLGWLGTSALAVSRLTARPAPRHAERLPDWLEAEDLRLRTEDGEELGAWFHGGAPGRACVILLHGMGGSRVSMSVAAKHLTRRGNGFLALSQRAFGDSTGDSLDFGWSSRADLRAALEFLEAKRSGEPVVVIGQSLGAATAIYAAPELGRRVAGYVLEAPYHDLEKACRDRLSGVLWSPVVDVVLTGMRLCAPAFLPVGLERLRPVDAVVELPAGMPVLFVAGSSDVLAPAEDVRLLSERCGGRAEFLLLEGRTHMDLWKLDEPHWNAWDDFLSRVEAASADATDSR